MPSGVNHVLIVSASIGSGHTQAAHAVKDELQRQHPHIAVSIVDFMAGDQFSVAGFIKETYLKMIDIFPHIYDLLYRWSQERQQGSAVGHVMSWFLKKRMLRLIQQHRPDLVVFTHPFPCGAACHLKRKGKISTPLIGVITDYAIHRLWVYDEVDVYFTAAPAVQDSLAKQGITAERIQITGIPISPAFHGLRESPATNVAKTEPTVLIMGGGLGLGDLEEVLLRLDEMPGQQQFVVVTGRNASLYRALQAMSRQLKHSVSILGYTHRVPELMASADLLVTKPGALTCSEALAAGLPMVLVNAIPGQEEDNAGYLHRHGAALWVQDQDTLAAVVHELLNSPHRLTAMGHQARQLSRPDAARQIVRYLTSPSLDTAAGIR